MYYTVNFIYGNFNQESFNYSRVHFYEFYTKNSLQFLCQRTPKEGNSRMKIIL